MSKDKTRFLNKCWLQDIEVIHTGRYSLQPRSFWVGKVSKFVFRSDGEFVRCLSLYVRQACAIALPWIQVKYVANKTASVRSLQFLERLWLGGCNKSSPWRQQTVTNWVVMFPSLRPRSQARRSTWLTMARLCFVNRREIDILGETIVYWNSAVGVSSLQCRTVIKTLGLRQLTDRPGRVPQFCQLTRDGEVYHEYCLNYSKAMTYLERLRKNDDFCEFEKVSTCSYFNDLRSF